MKYAIVKMPNGLTDYLETYHWFTRTIWLALDNNRANFEGNFIDVKMNLGGNGGILELCEDLTNIFEHEHQGVKWGFEMDFEDTIARFLEDIWELNLAEFLAWTEKLKESHSIGVDTIQKLQLCEQILSEDGYIGVTKWCKADVIREAKESGHYISEKAMVEIIDKLENNADSICWDSIQFWIEKLGMPMLDYLRAKKTAYVDKVRQYMFDMFKIVPMTEEYPSFGDGEFGGFLDTLEAGELRQEGMSILDEWCEFTGI
jgi:hypothetical protein